MTLQFFIEAFPFSLGLFRSRSLLGILTLTNTCLFPLLFQFAHERSEPVYYTKEDGSNSFFSVGCPVCNKLVVLLLGIGGAMTFFNPLLPFLGMASIVLLGVTLFL